jgi:sensor histidine kinase regulating citrate/malate metabolism
VIGHLIVAAGYLACFAFGVWRGMSIERRVTRQVFEESAQEHDRLTRQLEAVRRQLAAAVVRAVDEP